MNDEVIGFVNIKDDPLYLKGYEAAYKEMEYETGECRSCNKLADEITRLRKELVLAWETNSEKELRQQVSALTEQRDLAVEALYSAVQTMEWMHGCSAPADDEVEKAIREGKQALVATQYAEVTK